MSSIGNELSVGISILRSEYRCIVFLLIQGAAQDQAGFGHDLDPDPALLPRGGATQGQGPKLAPSLWEKALDGVRGYHPNGWGLLICACVGAFLSDRPQSRLGNDRPPPIF